MNITLLIIVIVANIASVVVFVVIERETRHVIRSHVHILGHENEELVNTLRLKIIRIAHIIAVILLAVGSYYLFFMS